MVSMLRCICWKRVASLFLKASSIADGRKMLAMGSSEKQNSLPRAMLRHHRARERAEAREGPQRRAFRRPKGLKKEKYSPLTMRLCRAALTPLLVSPLSWQIWDNWRFSSWLLFTSLTRAWSSCLCMEVMVLGRGERVVVVSSVTAS